jgi:26S proteasome non-ATPase regulatory subunit 9
MASALPFDPAADATEWELAAAAATDDGSALSVAARLALLDQTKAELEVSAAQAQRYLGTTSVGVRGSLIDEEGFPKPDVDHYAVRAARHAIDCARHDLRRINDRMMDLLVARQQERQGVATVAAGAGDAVATGGPPRQPVAAAAAAGVPPSSQAGVLPTAAAPSAPPAEPHRVLFRVSSVSAGSPAATAGLTVGTLVLNFGPVQAADLRLVAAHVRDNVGQPVPLRIVRAGGRAEDATLTPQSWSGSGLLGCTLTVA